MRKGFAMMCLVAALPVQASPCTGMDRPVASAQQREWASSIARQLKVAHVDVLQAFGSGDWRIVYVGTPRSDNGFLFYRGDPAHSRYITLWAGSAQADETAGIEHWVLANVPGIPPALAKCFAWHVTQDRHR